MANPPCPVDVPRHDDQPLEPALAQPTPRDVENDRGQLTRERLEYVKELGRGAQAVVVLVQAAGKEYALKIPHTTKSAMAQLNSEATLLKKLKHVRGFHTSIPDSY